MSTVFRLTIPHEGVVKIDVKKRGFLSRYGLSKLFLIWA